MIENILTGFVDGVAGSKIEIYNEFSLQHELGIYLRSALPDRKIEFERNVSFFGFDKTKFVKHEIDISVFRSTNSIPEIAIELKYPRNGQHPEQMYSFCKDIVFTEQLKAAGFQHAYVVMFAEDRLFYEGNQSGIYGFFRGGNILSGEVQKPTGNKESKIYLQGKYIIQWQIVRDPLKYTMIRAQ